MSAATISSPLGGLSRAMITPGNTNATSIACSVNLKYTGGELNGFGRLSTRLSTQLKATYKVKLVMPNGVESEFEAPDAMYILDSAEAAGLELQHTCRAGACSACVAKIESGTVDQSDQSFLNDKQIEAGYVLPCVAYPTSDCVIHTNKDCDFY